MKFEALRDTLLKPIQAVVGVVERRQTMPILANLLVTAQEGVLSITATDLEVELVAKAEMNVKEKGEVTVPARKLLDICRALPEGSKVSITLDHERITVRSGRSRFTLATLPAAEFPAVEDIKAQRSVSLPQKQLKQLIEHTHFAMAQQDVRYYLNGLLLETLPKRMRAVATDGHRLAMCDLNADVADLPAQQVIVPRKGVMELQRLLTDSDTPVKVSFGTNHVRVELADLRFTTKLIDGRFPDYERVVPKGGDKDIIADRLILKDALSRTAILSNEKYRGVRLQLSQNRLKVLAHNPEQEEAEDEVEVKYSGGDLEIGFNVSYLMDALGALHSEQVRITLTDANSSCLIREPDSEDSRYVVMPMRL
jgi:DNA polymerase-3 subunit beta